MLLNIFSEVLRRVVACELIGILSAGQQQDPEAHTFREQHVGTAQGCMYAGSVAVVDQRDVRGETVEHVYLMDAQCRS